MDRFGDDTTETIVMVTGTQVGKTEALLNMTGYAIDQDPGPTLIVYPTQDLAEYAANKRILKMVAASPKLAAHYIEGKSTKLEMQFDAMYLSFGWSNSPATLASKPCRRVLLDETDKFPIQSGKEADPVSLAFERTKNFWDRKRVLASTPTTEIGPIWTHYIASDGKREYFVPCPHCGAVQQLKMLNIRWPEGATPSTAKALAWYECDSCKQRIEDRHKMKMLRAGEWRWVTWDDGAFVEAPEPEVPPSSVGYHLSSLYSPWVTWGQVAEQFLMSQEHPELLMNFVNSWLGEPWRTRAEKRKSDLVLSRSWTHQRGEVPADALLLTAGVDCQKDHFYWVVRAWGYKVTSWLVDYGRVETWGELENILVHQVYRDNAGGEYIVALAAIDSGYKPDDTYEFCVSWSDMAIPVKGSSTRLAPLYTVSALDSKAGGSLKLISVDTHQAKDFISGRLDGKEAGQAGAWMVPADCDRSYADQIVAEHKIQTRAKKGGGLVEEWRQIGHQPNHYLDCEVYAYVAAELARVRYLVPPLNEPEKAIQPAPVVANDPFTNRKPLLDRR